MVVEVTDDTWFGVVVLRSTPYALIPTVTPAVIGFVVQVSVSEEVVPVHPVRLIDRIVLECAVSLGDGRRASGEGRRRGRRRALCPTPPARPEWRETASKPWTDPWTDADEWQFSREPRSPLELLSPSVRHSTLVTTYRPVPRGPAFITGVLVSRPSGGLSRVSVISSKPHFSPRVLAGRGRGPIRDSTTSAKSEVAGPRSSSGRYRRRPLPRVKLGHEDSTGRGRDHRAQSRVHRAPSTSQCGAPSAVAEGERAVDGDRGQATKVRPPRSGHGTDGSASCTCRNGAVEPTKRTPVRRPLSPRETHQART